MEFQFRELVKPADFAAGYGRPMLETPRERQRRLLYNIYLNDRTARCPLGVAKIEPSKS